MTGLTINALPSATDRGFVPDLDLAKGILGAEGGNSIEKAGSIIRILKAAGKDVNSVAQGNAGILPDPDTDLGKALAGVAGVASSAYVPVSQVTGNVTVQRPDGSKFNGWDATAEYYQTAYGLDWVEPEMARVVPLLGREFLRALGRGVYLEYSKAGLKPECLSELFNWVRLDGLMGKLGLESTHYHMEDGEGVDIATAKAIKENKYDELPEQGGKALAIMYRAIPSNPNGEDTPAEELREMAKQVHDINVKRDKVGLPLVTLLVETAYEAQWAHKEPGADGGYLVNPLEEAFSEDPGPMVPLAVVRTGAKTFGVSQPGQGDGFFSTVALQNMIDDQLPGVATTAGMAATISARDPRILDQVKAHQERLYLSQKAGTEALIKGGMEITNKEPSMMKRSPIPEGVIGKRVNVEGYGDFDIKDGQSLINLFAYLSGNVMVNNEATWKGETIHSARIALREEGKEYEEKLVSMAKDWNTLIKTIQEEEEEESIPPSEIIAGGAAEPS